MRYLLLAVLPLLGSCWLTNQEAAEAGRRGLSAAGAVLNGDYGTAAGETIDMILILLGLKGAGKGIMAGKSAVESAVRKRRARRVTTIAACDPSDGVASADG